MRAWASRMVLQVHDELDFECPLDEVEKLTALVRDEMENVVKLRVPLIAEALRARPGRTPSSTDSRYIAREAPSPEYALRGILRGRGLPLLASLWVLRGCAQACTEACASTARRLI